MSESEKKFEAYNWNEDEKWQTKLKNMEIPAQWSQSKQDEFLLKKKRKYYQENIDTSYKIPEEPKKSTPTYTGSNSTHNTTDSTSNDNSNTNTENTKSYPSSSSSSSSTRSTPTPTSTSSTSTSSISSFLSQRFKNISNFYYLFSQWFAFFNCILSIVMPSSQYRALVAIIIAHLLSAFQKNGMPKFNMYYAQKLFQDENIMIAIYGLIFLMAPPSFIFLIPVALRSFFMGCSLANGFVRKLNIQKFSDLATPLLARVLQQQQWFLQNIALTEVFVGFYLIISCLFMPRSFILVIIYWQIMHARYMMNSNIKQAFTVVNIKIESILRNVPFLLNLYHKLTTYLASTVDPEKIRQTMEQGNQRRCVIM